MSPGSATGSSTGLVLLLLSQTFLIVALIKLLP